MFAGNGAVPPLRSEAGGWAGKITSGRSGMVVVVVEFDPTRDWSVSEAASDGEGEASTGSRLEKFGSGAYSWKRRGAAPRATR